MLTFNNTYQHLSGEYTAGTLAELESASWTPRSCVQCADGFLDYDAKGDLCEKCQMEFDEFWRYERQRGNPPI